MNKIILKNGLYKYLFYTFLITSVLLSSICVINHFHLAFVVLLLIVAFVFYGLDKYFFELKIELEDNSIKIKTMKMENILAKDDIKSVFVSFNTSADMESKIYFILKNDEKLTYSFTNKIHLANIYKLLENMSLFPNFEYDIIGTMPACEIAIDYYIKNGKKMNFIQLYIATLENYNVIVRYLFVGIFCFSIAFLVIVMAFCFSLSLF